MRYIAAIGVCLRAAGCLMLHSAFFEVKLPVSPSVLSASLAKGADKQIQISARIVADESSVELGRFEHLNESEALLVCSPSWCFEEESQREGVAPKTTKG
jgi:hypothetical protein